jgi:hypothetical protein
MRAASARHDEVASRPSVAAAIAAHIHLCLRVSLRIDRAPVAYRMLAILPDDHQYPKLYPESEIPEIEWFREAFD